MKRYPKYPSAKRQPLHNKIKPRITPLLVIDANANNALQREAPARTQRDRPRLFDYTQIDTRSTPAAGISTTKGGHFTALAAPHCDNEWRRAVSLTMHRSGLHYTVCRSLEQSIKSNVSIKRPDERIQWRQNLHRGGWVILSVLRFSITRRTAEADFLSEPIGVSERGTYPRIVALLPPAAESGHVLGSVGSDWLERAL